MKNSKINLSDESTFFKNLHAATKENQRVGDRIRNNMFSMNTNNIFIMDCNQIIIAELCIDNFVPITYKKSNKGNILINKSTNEITINFEK